MAACSLHALSSLRNSFNSRFNASSKPEATRPELRRQSSQLPKIPATQISTMARNVAPPGRLAEPVEFGQAMAAAARSKRASVSPSHSY